MALSNNAKTDAARERSCPSPGGDNGASIHRLYRVHTSEFAVARHHKPVVPEFSAGGTVCYN